jgi:hypothetical protein
MKKFCSECGHPLEISKKFCSDCGTLNPFFLISQEVPTARSGIIDTLRARKESIERELEEIEREQAEALRKEKLRLEMEELNRQRIARLEKEREIKERFEREGIEASIKKELQQVKDETEQYKRQTTELLKELRGIIFQIDEENKKLKEELQQIAKTQVTTPFVKEEVSVQKQQEQVKEEVAGATIVEEPSVQEELEQKTFNNSWVIGVVILLIIVAGGLFAFFYSNYKSSLPAETTTIETSSSKTDVSVPSEKPKENADHTMLPTAAPETKEEQVNAVVVENNSTVPAANESKPPRQKVTVTQKEKTVLPTADEPKPKTETEFSLTAVQAQSDLVGKKLSGCGIILNSASEIDAIGNPIMVENAPVSGYIKYKLSLKVKQGGETYQVTPYMYYTNTGKFIRVDATNCE